MAVSESEIIAAVEALAPRLVEFLQELVRTPSLPDHEHEVQATVADKLRLLGMDVDVFECRYDDVEDHPAFTDDGFSPASRVDVVGRWRASGDGTAAHGSLVLNGHADVVPLGDPARWSVDPWGGEIRDGLLYGRGAADMKSGLAASIFALEALRALGVELAHDVLVQSVIGEESGGLGTLSAIARGYVADAVVIFEPTCLRMCPAQAGALACRITVEGRSAHAATRAEGVSAIEKFHVLFDALRDLETARNRDFRHPLFPEGSLVSAINVGTVHAGDWHSSVPDKLVAEVRYGVLPGESVATAKKVLEEAIGAAATSDQWLSEHPPALEWFEGEFESGETPLDSRLLAVLGAVHESVVGAPASVEGVPYGSDLRLFTNHASMPAVLYGPGDVRRAHAADEFVAVDEVVTAAKVAAVFVARWCGAS